MVMKVLAEQDVAQVQALPPIRTDLESAKRDLDEFGLTRYHGALKPADLSRLQNRLAEQAAAEKARGIGWLEGPNQRVWNLPNKGEVFREWAINPAVMELVGRVLGPEFLLSSLTANIACKGGAAMGLHGDQQFAPPLPIPVVSEAILMLVDFTPDNGATEIIPGSHLFGRWPARDEPRNTLPVVGPAGTILVYDGRLWHGTGANRTETPRPALLGAYCSPFMRQQENFSLSLAPEVFEQCSPELRALLGFKTYQGSLLGMVSGSPANHMNKRPDHFVTELS